MHSQNDQLLFRLIGQLVDHGSGIYRKLKLSFTRVLVIFGQREVDHPLTKKPEDSGYEIGRSGCSHVASRRIISLMPGHKAGQFDLDEQILLIDNSLTFFPLHIPRFL